LYESFSDDFGGGVFEEGDPTRNIVDYCWGSVIVGEAEEEAVDGGSGDLGVVAGEWVGAEEGVLIIVLYGVISESLSEEDGEEAATNWALCPEFLRHDAEDVVAVGVLEDGVFGEFDDFFGFEDEAGDGFALFDGEEEVGGVFFKEGSDAFTAADPF
jgi:hypothetical protein